MGFEALLHRGLSWQLAVGSSGGLAVKERRLFLPFFGLPTVLTPTAFPCQLPTANYLLISSIASLREHSRGGAPSRPFRLKERRSASRLPKVTKKGMPETWASLARFPKV